LRPFPDRATLPTLVRGAAERFADREWIVTPTASLTYADADAQSRQLAARLVQAGVGKGTRVGLLFPQGADIVVAILAVARVGAIAVPLSTFLRGPEVHRVVRLVDVDTLIVANPLLDRDMETELESIWPELATAGDRRLLLTDVPYLRHVWMCGAATRPWATPMPPIDTLDDALPVPDALLDAIEREVVPADPVLIVATSGATSEPKAVVHTHGVEVRESWKLAQVYELTAEPQSRVFTTMPFFWVGGFTVTVLTYLHVGGAVITPPRTDSTEMLDLIEAAHPDRLLGWTIVERLVGDSTYAQRDLGWLGLDDALPMGTPLRHNSLGMTETSGPHTVAFASANVEDLPPHLHGSFGPPIDGMQHKIVDPVTGEQLPDGVEGEICLRGDTLMDSLYKKERFEYLDADGWYHSGDKGTMREGLLFFTGRLTEMIKTGGANVAPLEVELAIEEHPDVQRAFVVGIPDAQRGQLVGAIVCPEPGHEVDVAALTGALRGSLSSYKIPRRVRVMAYEDLPWLPSGKLSKPKLVDLFTDSDD
jgi:acyl-CoA synthetase (AMP-forming)/AMP-acid ligase II